MKIIILGSGMMGRVIAYDLCKHSKFDSITIADKDNQTLQSAEKFLEGKMVGFTHLDVDYTSEVRKYFERNDVAISAIPYKYNYNLAKTAIENKTHFLDLGGNNEIVKKEKTLFDKARKKSVTVIPDCGLAPGLTSVITRDIVERMDSIDYVKIRVGGLPINPEPPFNYQIVFSPYGLINEYVEDAIVLDKGKIIKKKPMTEIEKIDFPKPFGVMEAFVTSGGCSTLPYTYKEKIGYLDYKTIRYPGHCEKFKLLLDLGLAGEVPIVVGNRKVIPRDLLNVILLNNLPSGGRDVVLLKVLSRGIKNGEKRFLGYTMIDHYDEENDITAMMRTTAYPVSIIAQMLEDLTINQRGVFCPEEIVPSRPFFEELEKRDILIKETVK